MTTLFFNGYHSDSAQPSTPIWMREERYGYCEPFSQPVQTIKSLWHRFLQLFS